MSAPSFVLYALHNGIEPRGFENLCVDLLVREGYSRIVPGGKNRDHGRDAEVRFWMDINVGSPQTVFQFSMEKKWEGKLRRDIATIKRKCETIERLVFVSNRSITVEKQDKLRREIRDRDSIILEILDEGWFRVRLEEQHVDLAQKHLGVTVPPTPSFFAAQVTMHGLTDENQSEILRHTAPETLRATLRARTIADPKNASAWKGLAHVNFFLNDYEDALLATTKAIKLSTDELDRWNLIALKASIIAEQGIKSGSRPLLKKAQELFTPFVSKWGRAIDHYNMANVLGALNESERAEFHYRRSLDIDPSYAQGWKNLGSLLFQLKKTDEGMDCIDKALTLNPNLLEALCTKANILVMSSNKCSEAIFLMERVFAIDPDIELRWTHAHYWYALALCRGNRLQEALAVVGDRLERKFDCPYLGRLVADILAELWKTDPKYLKKAEEHFASRVNSEQSDYRALKQLLDILVVTDRESEAWITFSRFLNLREIPIGTLAARIGVSISDFTDSFSSMEFYKAFRESSPLVSYAAILDSFKLEPHDEIPGILFHLFLVSYYKLAAVWQHSELETDRVAGFNKETEALHEIYELNTRSLAGLGGWLLAPAVPNNEDKRVSLISAGIVAGMDIPLIETSRLLGYLSGVTDRSLPESNRDTLIAMTGNIQNIWISEFLHSVGDDWQIEPLRD